jgi:flavin reductase (DIM6/NTAB) family NADH-FMN oxidoreductase RutF
MGATDRVGQRLNGAPMARSIDGYISGITMDKHISAVALEKSYRLINHGPTVLVSARHDGVDDVMAAAWCSALDFAPPKLTVCWTRHRRRAR